MDARRLTGPEWLSQHFAPKQHGTRRCRYEIAATGAGPNRDQPIYCSESMKSSTSTGNLAKHLVVKHANVRHGDHRTLLTGLNEHYKGIVDQWSQSRKRPRDDSSQTTIQTSFQPLHNAQLHQAIARCFASCSLPHHLADHPDFLAMMAAFRAADTRFPCRQRIAPLVSSERDALYADLVQRLRDQSRKCPVTLAFDGWTNVRHMKVINVVLLCKGVAYYWSSRVSQDGRGEAAVVAAQLSDDLNSLAAVGIIVSAVTGDNEAVNKAAFKILHEKFPALVYVPCAAHTLQLCVRRAFRTDSVAAEVRATTNRIVNHICRSKALRTRVRNMQEREVETGERKSVLTLIRPNATRWSSDYHAFARVLSLQKIIVYVLADEREFAIPSEYWHSVQIVTTFLQPFTIATNIIQSDSAGLVDVFVQFDRLMKHCNDIIDEDGPMATMAATMLNAIRHHWSKHVHQKAVLACVQLAFTRLHHSELFSEAARRHWWRWLQRWGAAYLRANQTQLQLHYRDADAMVTSFRDQLTQFIQEQRPFDNFARQISEKARPVRSGDDPLFFTFDAREHWLYMVTAAPELSYVALALLSINCSEASVERSFRAQSATHSKTRNRLMDANIEKEMFVKLNTRALNDSSIRRPLVHLPVATAENNTIARAASAADPSDDEPESDDDDHVYDSNDADTLMVDSSDDEEALDSDDEPTLRDSNIDRESDSDPTSTDFFRPASSLSASSSSLSSTIVSSSEGQLRPPQPGYSYRPRITPSYSKFCRTFITEHRLLHHQPWQRGVTDKLETAMRCDSVMRREQVRNVKQYIELLLQHDIADAAATADATTAADVKDDNFPPASLVPGGEASSA